MSTVLEGGGEDLCWALGFAALVADGAVAELRGGAAFFVVVCGRGCRGWL